MSDFEIIATMLPDGDASALRRLRLDAGGLTLTKLIRPGESVPDDYLHVPPASLAFWFIDNWWRIRFEPAPPGRFDAAWRLAHDFSSIGGGYLWPQVAIWGEGARLGVAAQSEPLTAPFRFLADGFRYVPACAVEASVDQFIRGLLDEDTPDAGALEAQYQQLVAEGRDNDTAAWRKLEAMLGFDADEAPEALIARLGAFAEEFGHANIAETALARPGDDAADILEQEVGATRRSNVQIRLPDAVNEVRVDTAGADQSPWELGENAAAALRDLLSQSPGPILNRRLSELLELDVARLGGKGHPTVGYGLRIKDDNGETQRLLLKSKWSHNRRFELCRIVGDVIWSGNSRLGPISAAKSARQKFQRAFAQSFLCPFSDLLEYVGDHPTNYHVEAAARHFHVSERMIQSTLVNKSVIERNAFDEMIEAA